MPAGPVDLIVEPGADLLEAFDYTALTDVDGSTFDFSTGWTAASQVRRHYDSETVLLELDVDLSVDNKITVSAPAVDTEEITQSGVWDLELTQTSGGRIIRLFQGRAKLKKQVTRVGS